MLKPSRALWSSWAQKPFQQLLIGKGGDAETWEEQPTNPGIGSWVRLKGIHLTISLSSSTELVQFSHSVVSDSL